MSIRIPLVALGAAVALGMTAATAQPSQTPQEILEAAPESAWVKIDPENLLEMDLPAGPMVIEMRPDIAPETVERIKTLTRRGFYDGTIFHRVIEGFVAQGGDPTGTGRGGSDLPDIPGEFARDLGETANTVIIGRDAQAAQIGFVGTVPVGTQAATLPKFLNRNVTALWGLHCPGVMSMARASAPDSGNSQFFILFGDSRDQLDQAYTVWGNVIDGFRNARRINRGEPPPRPTPIVRMRMMSDIPADEQKTYEYLNPASETFQQLLEATYNRTEDGYIRNICGVDVPIRINGELPE